MGRRNYELNNLPHDSRTFCCADAVRFVKQTAKEAWRGRYDLILLDPPPRFGRRRKQSEWDFDARRDFGKLLGLCLQVIHKPHSHPHPKKACIL